MQNLKTIIVTGSNKGVGYGIVENLAGKQGWNIIMACRNVELAAKSRDELAAKFPKASIHVEQLDVSKSDSIKAFAEKIKDKYHNIDVLLNNAGMAFKGDAFGPEVVKETFQTVILLIIQNFYGTIEATEAILPYINENGKVIFVGSMAGKVESLKSEELKKRLMNDKLTKEELIALLKEFEKGVEEGNFEEKGWKKSIYGTSKIGINLYAGVLSRYPEVIKRKIQSYACCPGYVDTDMTSHKGPLTIQEGALTPVFLAELPFEVNEKYQGQFFQKSALSSLI